MPNIIDGEPPERRKQRKGNPVRASKSAEIEYRRALIRLNRQIKIATLMIASQISSGVDPAIVTRNVERALDNAKNEYERAANRLAQVFVGKISDDNKAKIQRVLTNALGVDVTFLDNKAIKQRIELAVADNVRLIKSIPEKHFTKVQQAVFDNYRGVKFKEGSLRNRLMAIGRITDQQAKFLARDQAAKFATSLNAARQEDAGIEGYIWRNQGDERVVGNPSGKYPKGNAAHMDHWKREGKVFKWDDPPPDGHPGQAIGCRCFAEPIVNVEKVKKNAL